MDSVDQPRRHGGRPLLRDQRLPDRDDPVQRVPHIGEHSDQAVLRPPLPAPDSRLHRRDDRRAGLRAQHSARGGADGIPALHERQQHVGEFPLRQQLPADQPAIHGMVLVARDRRTVLPDPPRLHPHRDAVRPADACPRSPDGARRHHSLGGDRPAWVRAAIPRPSQHAILGRSLHDRYTRTSTRGTALCLPESSAPT